jgi:uncharacterized protein with PIN domain
MITNHLRIYAELRHFLHRSLRQGRVEVRSHESRSVKDLIESLGIPHTEVDLILCDGTPVGFEHQTRDGERFGVYPCFRCLPVTGADSGLRPTPTTVQFMADVNLGKLTRRLRLLGFSCAFDPAWDDAELAARSAAEERILLTRDRGLLMRATVVHGVYVQSDLVEDQIREVLLRLPEGTCPRPFSRCLTCDGLLAPVDTALVRHRVPPLTLEYVDEFFECRGCGKLFWRGTHWPKLRREVDRALETWQQDRERCQSGELPER